MGDLAADTAVRGGDGRYVATFVKDWNIWGPCGGYVAAVAIRAMGAHTELTRPASFSCHFLGVAAFRDVDIEVRTLRKGKRAESVALSMSQDDEPILEAVGWMIGDVEGMDHDFARFPPDIPSPDDLKTIEELLTPEELKEDQPFYFWKNFDEKPPRWTPREDWEKWPGGEPTFQQWVRYRPTAVFDDPFLEAARQLIPLDVAMWPAATRAYARGTLNYMAPSLDLSAVFHRLDTKSEWLFIDGYSPVAADGIVGGSGRVWSQEGTLLCSGVQSMLCRPTPQRR